MQAADRMTVLGVKLALEDAGFAPVKTEDGHWICRG